MIQIPQLGFRQSINESNVSVNALGDWLEANLVFGEEPVTKSAVVDLLIKYNICTATGQDLAHSIAAEGWSELKRRRKWGGLSECIEISRTQVFEDILWTDSIVRSFFLLLSLLKIFPDWANRHRDYVSQGNLFEKVVEEICPAILPGWKSFRAGWAPDNTQDVPSILSELRDRLNVAGAADPTRWYKPGTKDAGLDIVCYREFEDEKEALPTLFLQCASGKNWREKVTTPNPELWSRLMDSAVKPGTGIAAPFVVEDQELRAAALTGQVVVFDRLRMLSAVRNEKVQIPSELQNQLVDWMRPRVEDIPKVT